MATISKTTLTKWVRSCVDGGHQGDDCNGFVLFHVDSNQKLKNVDSWKVDPDFKVGVKTDEMWESAHSDCAGQKDVNEYVICAYFGEPSAQGANGEARAGIGSYGRRKRFGIHPTADEGSDDDGGMTATEAPTQKGMQAMMMRQMDGLFKSAVPWSNELMRKSMDDGARKDLRIKELEEERDGMVRLQEELLSHQHARAMELRKELFWERKKEMAFEKVFPLIQIGLQQFMQKHLGKKFIAENPTMMMEGLKTFAQSIKPEQLEGLSKIFAPEQMMLIGSMIEAVMDKEEDQKNKEKEQLKEVDARLQPPPTQPFTVIQILEGTGAELLEKEREEIRQKKAAERAASRGEDKTENKTEEPDPSS